MAGTFIQLLMDPRSVIAGAIGLSIVLGLVWFVPVIIALIVGIVMKNSAIVERGPTGRTEW